MFGFSRRSAKSEYATSLIVDSEFKIENFGRFTFGLSTMGRNGTFGPNAFVAFDMPGDTLAGYYRKSLRTDLPFLPFGKAYRFRRFGGLVAYRLINSAYRRLINL